MIRAQKGMHPDIWELLAFQQGQPLARVADHLNGCQRCLNELLKIDLDQALQPQTDSKIPRFRVRENILQAFGFQLIAQPAFRSERATATIHSAIVPLTESYLIFELRSSTEALELAVEKGGAGTTFIQFYCNDRLVEQTAVEETSRWNLHSFTAGHYHVFARENGPQSRKILEFNLHQDRVGSKKRNRATA